MGSLNRVMLIGNLGKDAELRTTQGGQTVANFNLACNEVWNDRNGERQERTEWVRCVLWGKKAESLEKYLLKGKQIHVEGKLQTREWEDRDGNKRWTTEVNVFNVVLLGSGGGGGGRSGGRRRQDESEPSADAGSAMAEPIDMPEDDIPF